MPGPDGTGTGPTPAEWDRLAAGHFYSTSAWLRFCEAEYGGDSGAVVSYLDGAAACAVPFTRVTGPSVPSKYRWNELLAESGLLALAPTGLLVGPREGYQTHLLGPAAGEPAAVADVVDQLRRLHADGDTGDQACVALYLTTPDVVTLRRAGITSPPVLITEDAWIEVPEGAWQGWFDALTSKNRRKVVRQDVRKFTEAGYRIERIPLAECYQRLGAAAAATVSKYEPDMAGVEEETRALGSHAEHMGAAAMVAMCSIGDGDPLGFCLYYLWGDTIFLRWAGFDYARLAGAAEYFNVVYYSQIELAAEVGARWVHAGITMPATKALRGAQLRPLWLIDLLENSPLKRCADQIRDHNTRRYEELAADPRTAPGLGDGQAWHAFD